MSETESGGDHFDEHCSECGRTTPHSVRLEIRTEAPDRDDVGHSRTPYRITTCRSCGSQFSHRMNGA